MKRLIYCLPRALAIGFSLFLSLFALDVFSEGYGLWEALLAFLIHLIPTFILLAALILAWYKELWGGMAFILLALFFVVWGRAELMSLLIIAGPALLIGLLFIVAGQVKTQ